MEISKKDYLNIFIEQFQEFIQDITKIFSDDKKIKTLMHKMYLYSLMQPKTLIQTWNTDIVNPYKAEIDKKNYNFFIETDWKNNKTHTDKLDQIDNIPSFNDLRETILLMTENNKIQTFKYIENLTKLCELYYSKTII